MEEKIFESIHKYLDAKKGATDAVQDVCNAIIEDLKKLLDQEDKKTPYDPDIELPW